MPIITVYDQSQKKVGELNLDDRVFKVPNRSHLIYDAVVAYGINQRQGTVSTKSRGNVRGGGAKPFRQKGTGRARQGSSRSAIQVGGGAAFGPKPKEYASALPKKAAKGALRVALTQKYKNKNIVVLKHLKMDAIKTKKLAALLNSFSLKKGIIVDTDNKELEKSAANLRSFKYSRPEGVNIYDLLKFENLFITEPAILKIEKRLQP